MSQAIPTTISPALNVCPSKGFTYLSDVDPTILQSVRYASNENFMGRPMAGYGAPTIILTAEAAAALKLVQHGLKDIGYGLVVYDAYRPQPTVDQIVIWSAELQDQTAKARYYPTIDKKDSFDLGYISKRSGHTRGSTVDLTLIKLGDHLKLVVTSQRTLMDQQTNIPFLDDGTVDMGSSFDLFHEASHHNSPFIHQDYNEKRTFLQEAMEKARFKAYEKEWWHYTLINEPFPNTYFDFPIVAKST